MISPDGGSPDIGKIVSIIQEGNFLTPEHIKTGIGMALEQGKKLNINPSDLSYGHPLKHLEKAASVLEKPEQLMKMFDLGGQIFSNEGRK